MSNFNEHFKSKGAEELVRRFFHNIDQNNPENKVTNFKWWLEEDEPNKPPTYFIENDLTATWVVKMEYDINNDGEIRKAQFEVPREVSGTFIIEGAYRIATNELATNTDCRIYMATGSKARIVFDWIRTYDVLEEELKIKIYKEGDYTGTETKTISIPRDKIDNFKDREKHLVLSEEQSKKFQIKLDLDEAPTHITTSLIDACIAFGDDRARDLVVDKRIDSVPESFMYFIFGRNHKRNFMKTRRMLVSHFTKYNKIQEEANTLSYLCFRFFKGSGDDSDETLENSLQVPPGINALNQDSWTTKVKVPKYMSFNRTMTDLIDLADTPINNSTNIHNSLTVSTHVTDDGVLFDVYDKNFQKITIKYLDYLNKKVVSSEYVDYETNTLKPDKEGNVEVKHRMKRKMVPKDEIDLIDLHPDYRLSSTSRRIPFVNFTDSVRISMGTSMLKQAIPITNAERPLVGTGNYAELEDNVLNEKFMKEEGVVTEITESDVIIELPNGKKREIPRRTAIQSVNDVSIYTEPKVKVGQKVKKGDVITGAVGIDKDSYRSGLNTLVLFHAYHGLVNEDALVISRSYAKRISSYSIIDLSFPIHDFSAIKWIAPVGTKVKTGDVVMQGFSASQLDAVNLALKEKIGDIFGDEDIKGELGRYVREFSNKIPNNIEDAIISDVMVQENPRPTHKSYKEPDLTFTFTSKKVIKEYMENKNRDKIYDLYPEYVASDTLDPIKLEKQSPRATLTVYTVRIRLIKTSVAVVGEKITSRYGGKGVVSKIVPDEEMPIVVDKKTGKKTRIEVVMNPYSTINRKIPSVIMESGLGLVAHKLHDMVEDYMRTESGKKKIKPLLEKYYPGRFTSSTVEQIIDRHSKEKIEEVYHFNVGSFSSLTPKKVEEWMEELGVEAQAKILMPEEELTDLKELQDLLPEEEYLSVVNGMKGKFIEVDKPLMVGYMTLERLYHIPSYSSKVTTSLFGKDVSSKRGEPIMGFGSYRETGQVIGEQELSVLLSRNAKKYIEDVRGESAKEDNQRFLSNLLGLGFTVTDNRGYNQGGSNLKDRMKKIKSKFKLKNA